MAVVAAAGEALRGDRSPLGPRGRLHHLEQREPHRLLQLGITVDLDVGAVPHVVEIRPLRCDETVPPERLAAASAAST